LRLRKLYQRTQMDERELRLLHGILADTQRMARLAAGQNAKSELGSGDSAEPQ